MRYRGILDLKGRIAVVVGGVPDSSEKSLSGVLPSLALSLSWPMPMAQGPRS